ncbi:MAG: arsenical pump-driving ATPase [Kiritimatiellia bacterium]|jgi:arsenite-transporting ATPase|nr:arsenical pump-driving ATPase [Kiritimatiellia bacterium]
MENSRLFETRFLFFTGKGGVGKTTLSCASAIHLAGMGKKTLLISTDPVSNLDEMLETELGSTPRPVEEVPNLWALNIDPEEAAVSYRNRIVDPIRGVLPEEAVSSIEEQLSGACTVEIASFNEFARVIGEENATEDFDHVVLDTAPTGHTLRLLNLPAAWNDFVEDNRTGSSCLGPVSGLNELKATIEKTLAALGDPASTKVVLVSRPDVSALKEAARAGAELDSLGIGNQFFVINGRFRALDGGDPVAVQLEKQADTALDSMPAYLKELPFLEIPFRPAGYVGVDSLKVLFLNEESSAQTIAPGAEVSIVDNLTTFSELIDALSSDDKGVILTMGKGGVGKTTIAAAIAVALAARGKKVHLSTTDPAAHLTESLNSNVEGLQVTRIDPEAETRKHIDHVMATTGAGLDEQGRELLEEELRSPCTEEIAVFRAFAETVAMGRDRFVVLDTAPTGHTLLLLDATEAYHRQVQRHDDNLPPEIVDLLPRLRDPEFTKVFIVTLPEATPVHEAARLQSDLKRAGITPAGWILNQSFAALKCTDPQLTQRARHEHRFITEVQTRLADSLSLIPWQTRPPKGVDGLSKLLEN